MGGSYKIDPLAYLTAKSNGLEEAQEILELSGKTYSDDLPVVKSETLQLPAAINPTFDYNWPSAGTHESFFDRALTKASGMDVDGEPVGEKDVDPLDDWAGEGDEQVYQDWAECHLG